MRFTINPKRFLALLAVLLRAVPKKPLDPNLGNIRLTMQKGKLNAEVTDGDIFLLTVVDTTDADAKSDGDILVPAQLLKDLLTSVNPDDTLEISTEGESLLVAWSNGNARLPWFDATPWPQRKAPDKGSATIKELPLDSEQLVKVFQKTLPATLDEPDKPALDAILLDLGTEKSTAVSSNMRILVCYPLEATVPDPVQLLLPADAATMLVPIMQRAQKDAPKDDKGNSGTVNATVTADELRTEVSCGTFLLTCSAVRSKFPDYRKIFPQPGQAPLLIDRDEFLSSLKRTASTINGGGSAIVLDLCGNSLRTTMTDPLAGAVIHESLSLVNYGGDDLQIAFNAKQIVTLLDMFDSGELCLHFDGPRKAVLVTPGEGNNDLLSAIIMPVQVPQNDKK